MLATSHVFAGAIVGASLRRRPAVAFAVGVASHVVMDMTPHWGTGGGQGAHQRFLQVARRDGVGVVAALAATTATAGRARRAVLAGGLGGLLLDLNKPCAHFFGRSPFPTPVDRFHRRIQQGKESPARWRSELHKAAILGVLSLAATSAARRRAAREQAPVEPDASASPGPGN